MTRVDFYILAQGNTAAALEYGGRLVEKASQLGHRVCVQLGDADSLAAFDRLLWHLKPETFIPHDTISKDERNDNDNNSPVLLGQAGDFANAPNTDCDLLINLSAAEAPGFGRFKRLAELVPASETTWLQASRSRWKRYQEKGYVLHKHDV